MGDYFDDPKKAQTRVGALPSILPLFLSSSYE
uniref:Uncharacterized protein n=1 Tax=Arundo donax TaxID=35708 RepID=A0A0A9HE26_ARUDO